VAGGERPAGGGDPGEGGTAYTSEEVAILREIRATVLPGVWGERLKLIHQAKIHFTGILEAYRRSGPKANLWRLLDEWAAWARQGSKSERQATVRGIMDLFAAYPEADAWYQGGEWQTQGETGMMADAETRAAASWCDWIPPLLGMPVLRAGVKSGACAPASRCATRGCPA
jgi:hypothetical protein